VSTNVVPIALRALVPLSASGGSFSGEATGGNGRDGWGQTEDFEFDVPAGTPALTVDVAGPAGSTIDGIPIDPQGNTPGFAETRDPNTGDATTALESVVLNPQPGLWTYVVAIYNNASGLAVQAPFTGTISLGAPDTVTPSAVPQSASTFIAPGASVNATVKIQNTSAVPLAASVDPRLNSIGSVPLTVTYPSGSSMQLPSLFGNSTVIVPPDTAQLNSTMQTTVGAGADFSLGWEGCCAEQASGASSASGAASLSIGSVPASITISPGPWYVTPNLLGPFASPTAISGTATFTVAAETLRFDPNVTSSTGDPWLSANSASAPNYSPLAISPGSSGTIDLTFSPPASTPAGTVVSGVLNVETFDSSLDQGTTFAQVPYEYTVGTAATAPAGPTTTTTATTTTVTGTTGSEKPDRATVKKLTVKGTAAVVSIACQGSAGTSCSLTLKLLRGKGRKAKVVGSLTVKVRAGLTSKLTVRLTKATVRLVARQPGHKLKLTLTVAQSNPGKKPTTLTTRTITFRS
jgi:hypothetical protein